MKKLSKTEELAREMYEFATEGLDWDRREGKK